MSFFLCVVTIKYYLPTFNIKRNADIKHDLLQVRLYFAHKQTKMIHHTMYRQLAGT